MKRIDFPGLFPGMLAVRVGCMLGYRVGTATPALLMIQPRPAPGQTVLSKRLEIGPGLKTEQKADIHGNPVAKVLLPPNLTEIRYDAILLVPHHADMPSTRPSPPCMVVPKRPGSLSGPIRSTQHRWMGDPVCLSFRGAAQLQPAVFSPTHFFKDQSEAHECETGISALSPD